MSNELIKDNSIILERFVAFPLIINHSPLVKMLKKKRYIRKVKTALHPETYMITRRGLKELGAKKL